MTQTISRNRLYLSLFFFILLVVIPYFIGGTSGILAAFIFIIPFAVVASLVMLLWRIPFLNRLQMQSPTLSLVLKAFMISIILVAFFIFIYTVTIPITLLPVAS